MNSITVSSNSQENSGSPFDSIRYFDDKGNEWWSARDLQKMLGYIKWDKFKQVIETASENLETVVADVFREILPVEVKSTTKPLLDYKLSRLACYHIALACDSRGNERVKLAKHYFVVKAREAEIVIPAQNDRIRELELMVRFSEAEADRSRAEQRLLDTRDTIVKMLPPAIADRVLGVTTIEKIETRTKIVDEAGFILNAGETVSKTDLAGRYGFVSKTGKPDTKTVTRLIDEAITSGAIPNPWKDVRVVASAGFDAELVPVLDKFFDANPAQRQRWMGE
jgi:DNA-damage-inducible protein D